MPEISIVIPVYNVESYLHRCLDSVLAQTFTDYELILVDDGSTDKSGFICDEYVKKDERVILFHQINQGQANARNVALDWVFANSDSKYITFIDSDDWAHPRYLELLYKANQQLDTNISQCLHIETDGFIENPSVGEHIKTITPEEQYINWYSASIWGKMYSRSIWEKLRFPEGQIYEDVAIWYRILFAECKIGLVEETLYYYFINENGTVRSEWTSSKLKQIEAWDNQISFLSSYGNKKILDCASMHLFQILRAHLIAITKTKSISWLEKKKYEVFVRIKLWRAILRFRKTPYYKQKRLAILESLFPRIMWVYWTAYGIKRKLLNSIKKRGF